jgi:hypothetical protein
LYGRCCLGLAAFFLTLRATSAFCNVKQSVDDILHRRQNSPPNARNL